MAGKNMEKIRLIKMQVCISVSLRAPALKDGKFFYGHKQMELRYSPKHHCAADRLMRSTLQESMLKYVSQLHFRFGLGHEGGVGFHSFYSVLHQ